MKTRITCDTKVASARQPRLQIYAQRRPIMALQLEDLVALDAPMPNTSGTPRMFDLNCIDEDPEQPRREFDETSLQELAETIRARGVRQPVSVRPSQQPGRWVLNFGARRLRAARMAGLVQIPAFVDTTADRYDQVIENEQREGLKPLELAMFVQKRLALGESQSEIARKLGKSRQWVAQATALIDPPDWLLQLYRDGRCRGLNELNDLRRLHAEHPEEVEPWLAQQDSITRDRLQDLRQSLARHEPPAVDAVEHHEAVQGNAASSGATADVLAAEPPATTPTASPAPERQDRATTSIRPDAAADQLSAGSVDLRIHVDLDGQDFVLVVTTAPVEAGHMYVVPASGGPRRSVPVVAMRLRGFVRR